MHDKKYFLHCKAIDEPGNKSAKLVHPKDHQAKRYGVGFNVLWNGSSPNLLPGLNVPRLFIFLPKTKSLMEMNANPDAVVYGENSLTIHIPTTTPAALHRLLLKGLVTGLTVRLLVEDFPSNEIDGLLALAQVLSAAIPTEMQLEKAYA